MKKIRIKLIFLFFSVIFFIVIGYYWKQDYKDMESILSHIEGDIINFNKENGFYDETIEISLSLDKEFPDDAEIYYTINGDDPTTCSNKYQNKIEIALDEERITVYPLKAVAYYNGEYSSIVQRTYIIGKDILTSYNLPVISITTDSKNLYDYYTGIFVPGYTYDTKPDYIEYAANYLNREEDWVRNGNLIMFNPDGTTILNQNVGLATSGGTSLVEGKKSLKIIANKGYDLNYDKFNLNILLHNNQEFSNLSFINEYNSFRLRAGQDYSYSNIRSSVISYLAQESNFDGYSATQKCIVYLNGEFYGILDMQQNYSDSFLANKFDLENNELIEKHKRWENIIMEETGLSSCFDVDLNLEENREKLEEYVDMDNYLLYYAIEILVNNTDWPMNNIEIWRYTGEEDINNKYTDGRYRFLIFDLDLIYLTEEDHNFFEGSKEDIFVCLMEEKYRGGNSTFLKVMKSEYYRNRFITIISDLLNTSFKKENILKIVDNEINKIKASNELLKVNEQNTYYATLIKQAVEKRDIDIRNDLQKYFNLSENYKLYLKTSSGISAKWNSMIIYGEEEYDNTYYQGVDFTIIQDVYPGYKFEYWIVNGIKYYDDSITINEKLIENEKVEIELIASKISEPVPIISEISAQSDSDWIKIYNVGTSLNISNYYISDDKENLRKYQLPNTVLENNEYIIINGDNNYYAIGDYICNFNLNNTETLYLYDSNENKIIDSVPIPIMDENETYGRYSNSNDFKYFNNISGERKK